MTDIEHDIEHDIEDMADEIASMSDKNRQKKLEAAKEILEGHAKELLNLEMQKKNLEVALDGVKKQFNALVDEIRNLWSPFFQGMDKCEMQLDNGLTLEMKDTLSISAEDKQEAIKWFLNNGFKDVMKWDIHHMTMAAIAREKYNDKEKPIQIPGLKYTNFPVIKVKS